MKTFIQDLWNDLREKRLWPVAVLLLVGLVAVPVVLSKPSAQPSVPPPPAAVAPEKADNAADTLASVKLEESLVEKGSALDTFDRGNPFHPPKTLLARAKAAAAPAAGSGPGAAAPADTATPTAASTDPGSGNAGGNGGGNTDPGTGAPVDPPVDRDDGPTTTEYTYVIDVTFTANGDTRRIKGVQALDILPNEASPVLIFLGASAGAGNAVFLVDSTLDTTGDGTCKPSKATCSFLYLGAGSEHKFSHADGDSYSLRIDEIRKVKIADLDAAGKAAVVGGAAIGAPDAPRHFVAPILAGVLSVSTP